MTHTYDWSQLTDAKRFKRARSTTPAMLQASLDRPADLAETVTLGPCAGLEFSMTPLLSGQLAP